MISAEVDDVDDVDKFRQGFVNLPGLYHQSVYYEAIDQAPL